MRLIFLYIIVVINCVVSEVTFGRVGTLLSVREKFPSLYSSRVVSIRGHLLEPNTFFICTNTSIILARLLPDRRYQLELIAGSVNESGYQDGEGTQARFDWMLDSAHTEQGLIVTDATNHCLRLIQPPTGTFSKWKTTTYAGRCQVRGYRDGKFLDSEFSFPFGLVAQNTTLIVSDYSNKLLRKLDMSSGEVTTFHSSNYNLLGLVLSTAENEHFVEANYGILRISKGKESWLVGGSKNATQKNKVPFSIARFSTVEAIAWLGDEILLITDHQTRTVKVVNLAKQEVDVICPSRTFQSADGDIKTCVLYYPFSIFVLEDIILIGQANGAIRTLEYQISDELTTTPRETSTAFTDTKLCENPPLLPHTTYGLLESYPEGSTVYYQCAVNYDRRTGSDNKLVCTYVNGELLWLGAQIECLPSTQMVTASVLAAICICTVIAIVVVAVKIRSINKQLEEATGRQTQVTMTTTKFTYAGSEAGCSNQYFNSNKERIHHSNNKNPNQKTSVPPCGTSEPWTSNAPKPAPRRTRQAEIYYNC